MKNIEYLFVIILFAVSAVPFYRLRRKVEKLKTGSLICPKCRKTTLTDMRLSFFGFIEAHCGSCKTHHKLPLSNSLRLIYAAWLSLFCYSFYLRFNIVTLLLIILVFNVALTDIRAILKRGFSKG